MFNFRKRTDEELQERKKLAKETIVKGAQLGAIVGCMIDYNNYYLGRVPILLIKTPACAAAGAAAGLILFAGNSLLNNAQSIEQSKKPKI